jgi:GntP family gluconate:H+ symporter
MEISFLHVSLCLLGGIAAIIILTTFLRVHAFFALLIAAFLVGLGVLLPAETVMNAVKDGFGNIMRSLGLIIVLGTTLGVILEHTGATKVMAAFILGRVGDRRAPLAMSLTGFIVGLPIFCDSGYIVLSGVNNSLAKRTGIPMAVMAGSLATGLYAVHCLLPPHPGAAAAAGIIEADFGKLMLFGIIVAIPAMFTGYAWVQFAGKKIQKNIPEQTIHEENVNPEAGNNPSVLNAFLPVFVPILLIAVRAILMNFTTPGTSLNLLLFIGDPAVALSVGVMLACTGKRNWTRSAFALQLQEAAEKAGGILVIIGAGGAFGAVLALTEIGKHFSNSMPLASMGILFPFLLTAVLKTAQGSSTVAIITAASIILPLMPALGLSSDTGKIITVLSMGAGSMMVAHANDAYFWVIAKFSGLDMRTMLKTYTISSVLMAIASLLFIYILKCILGAD